MAVYNKLYEQKNNKFVLLILRNINRKTIIWLLIFKKIVVILLINFPENDGVFMNDW